VEEKMLRKILTGILAAVVIAAAGFSAYNATAGTAPVLPSDTTTAPKLADPAAGGEPADPTESISPVDPKAIQPDDSAGLNEQSLLADSGQQGMGGRKGNGNGNGGGANGNGGGGNGGGNRWGGSNGRQAGGYDQNPETQNGFTGYVTLHGTVSDYLPPNFLLLSDDGQVISAQLGNQSYLESLGLSLSNGDSITVLGYWDANGSLAIGQVTVDSTGQTFILRDDLGRPNWRGGQNS